MALGKSPSNNTTTKVPITININPNDQLFKVRFFGLESSKFTMLRFVEFTFQTSISWSIIKTSKRTFFREMQISDLIICVFVNVIVTLYCISLHQLLCKGFIYILYSY